MLIIKRLVALLFDENKPGFDVVVKPSAPLFLFKVVIKWGC